jgi:hypothetical protein
MSVIIQGYQLRVSQFGMQTIKGPSTPPASGSTATIATVTNGSVMITSMVGLVTTVMGGTTGTISLGTTPTLGTAQNAGIAAAAVIGGKEVGTWLVPVVAAGVAGTLAVSGFGGNAVFLPTPFLVAAGTISWTTGVATMTGAVKWYFTWVPLDTGASLS